MYMKHRVLNFWKYFLANKEELEAAIKNEDYHEVKHILNDLNEKLKTVCLCSMEVEMSDTGFYEMTFTPQSNKNSQFATALLKKNAPKQLSEDWIINAFRPPLTTRAMNTIIKVKDKEVRGTDFHIYYTIDEVSKMINIKVYCEALKDLDESKKESIVSYMLELFIGELEFEARISSVEILDEPDQEAENFCLLPNFYEDICDIIVDEEWVEYHDPLSIYMAYKLDEKPVNETLRKDMKLIVTTNPQLQEEILNDTYDMCKEFSSCGGEYGYLYYEKLYEDEKEALVRQQLEKETNELLYDMSIARTMGGAVGIYYSYIDVVIFDKDAFKIALEKLNEKLSFKIYYQPFLKN